MLKRARLLGFGDHGRHTQRVSGLPEMNGELPVAGLADEITTPGEGQVRGMLIFAGNPVLSTPGGARLEEALATLEWCVAVDMYVTETTRHADVILPPVSTLERSDIDVVMPARLGAQPHPLQPGRGAQARRTGARTGRSWRR